MLRRLKVEISHLQQAREDALDILADIAGLGEHRGIHDGKRHLQQMGDGTRHQRLACTRGTDHDDIALLNLHAIVGLLLTEALVVVIDSHGEIALGVVLPDDILIQIGFDVGGFGERLPVELIEFTRSRFAIHGGFCLAVRLQSLLYDGVGLTGTVIADETVDTADEQANLFIAAAAERTMVMSLFLCHYLF